MSFDYWEIQVLELEQQQNKITMYRYFFYVQSFYAFALTIFSLFLVWGTYPYLHQFSGRLWMSNDVFIILSRS